MDTDRAGERDQLLLQERLRLAQEALARRLAFLPVFLRTIDFHGQVNLSKKSEKKLKEDELGRTTRSKNRGTGRL